MLCGICAAGALQANLRRARLPSVRRELSDYLEGDLSSELRAQIKKHLKTCGHCTAVYDGLRNVVRLLSDGRVIELPKGFSRRLYKCFMRPTW